MTEQVENPLSTLMDVIRSAAPKIAAAVEWIERNQEAVFSALGQFLEGNELSETGWLPHPILGSLAIGLIRRDGDARALVETHYRTNWARLKGDLLAAVRASDVDGRAKEVFDDAVYLHDAGQYRAVCRLIFPELERLVRQNLMTDPTSAATSLKELRSRLTRVPWVDHVSDRDTRALYLLAALESHLFEHINDAQALLKFEASGIPNRHACMHGLVDYNSYQNSLNMLILAQYCYSAIGRVRTQLP